MDPSVTIVFLVYNRRDQLRESLRRMLSAPGYPRERVDAIVVDNASTDGSADMVRDEFPEVRLIRRDSNVGVSGWNDGLREASGDFVLALDDDCYLPEGGLRRAIAAAEGWDADLVSFKVVSTDDPAWVFSDAYRTGLFSFWGCAVLMRRRVIEALGGYDPEIFVWANELEFMLRFFDCGFRHLYLPDVVAQHMKPPPSRNGGPVDWTPYRINARHFGYIAGKLLRPRDALATLVALLARDVRDAVREDPAVLRSVTDTIRGFAHGLRRRRPVRSSELSRAYARDFETFAAPWRLARPPHQLLASLPREVMREGVAIGHRRPPKPHSRFDLYFDERARFYPESADVLDFAEAAGR